MTPRQEKALRLALTLPADVLMQSFDEDKVRVTRPHSQEEFVDLLKGIWWPRVDDKLEVLLLDPLDWNVETEWLFGCRHCGRADGWIERIPNGAGFCLMECWDKGHDNPIFADYCHPFDWVIIRGGDKPLHPAWLYHTYNVFRIRGIPTYFAGWGEWIARTEIAEWEPNEDRASDWRFADGWRELIRGREWGIVNLFGEFFPETTTWNRRQLSPEDNEEVSIYKVGMVASLSLIGPEYQQFPKGLD